VVLIDATQESADRGRAHSEGLLDKGIQRRKVTPEKKAEVLGRITGHHRLCRACRLRSDRGSRVRRPKVKAEVTARVEAATGPDCIFATNTSTLPISSLAKASQRPDQFIGIHFFSRSTR
jgi:3-hydroxyacyl-CoA dehydrogenase / enoyl-CoA hydratase / 3-hydroxybutyryl-CoA epimerase